MASNKKPANIKIAGIVLIQIALVCIFCTVFCGGYTDVLNSFFESIEEFDSGKMMETMPECEIEYLEKSLEEYEAYDSVKEYVEIAFNSLMKGVTKEYGKDLSVDYEVTDEQDLSDKELVKIQNNLKSSFNAKDTEVSKGCKLKLDVTIKGSKKTDTQTATLKLAKVDGDWCIVENNFYNIFE